MSVDASGKPAANPELPQAFPSRPRATLTQPIEFPQPPWIWARLHPIQIGAQRHPAAEQFEELVVDGKITTRSRWLGRVLRTRKELGRTDLTSINGSLYAVADRDWSEARFAELSAVVSEIAARVDEPLTSDEKGSVTLSTGAVETSIFGGNHEYAADVLNPVLDGLSWGGRAEYMRRREEKGGEQLWDWGAGPMPMVPPLGADALPETLSHEELIAGLLESREGMPCFKARKQGSTEALRFRLRLVIAPTGKLVKVTATRGTGFGGEKRPTAAMLKCVERELIKRAWPPHTVQLEPFETDFVY